MEEKEEVVLVLEVIYKHRSPRRWKYVEILYASYENLLSRQLGIEKYKRNSVKIWGCVCVKFMYFK